MFKIEVETPTEGTRDDIDKKFRILCYTYNKNTKTKKESYSVSNKTLPEVAQFMKGRGEAYLEDDLLAFFQDAKRTHVYIGEDGKIIQPQ